MLCVITASAITDERFHGIEGISVEKNSVCDLLATPYFRDLEEAIPIEWRFCKPLILLAFCHKDQQR